MTDPMIVGWSHTRFGRSDAPDTCALMAEAVPLALNHAGITAADVDGIFTGDFNNGFSPQDFQGALVGMAVPELALAPATRYENACATGSAALHGAMDFIAAGRGRIALVVGAEKMTATPTSEVGDILLAPASTPRRHKSTPASQAFSVRSRPAISSATATGRRNWP